MNKDELCASACIFAISKLINKGSVAFGTSTEFIDDDGCIEKKYITIEWNDVIDWLTKMVEKQTGENT